MNVTKKKAGSFFAWFAYVIIFFEMLYMATPFAVFFYSVYKVPLQLLNSSDTTSWLIQTIFPHFIHSNSAFINILFVLSWPLMIIGISVFLISFIQIYWAKFRKKAAVTTGFYKWIRHPQYIAWIIFGLGMCILWSRMIVWIMYVVMIFVYYFLARAEEKECLKKYETTYKPYLENTGMFFFKIRKNKDHRKSLKLFPKSKVLRRLCITGIIILSVCITAVTGTGLRYYSINQLSTSFGKQYFAVSTIALDKHSIDAILLIAENNPILQKKLLETFSSANIQKLIYIMPADWNISELGVEAEQGDFGCDDNPLFDPVSHGNTKGSDYSKLKILFSEPVLEGNTDDEHILHNTKIQIPKVIAYVDTQTENITEINDAPASRYGNIPVPLY